MPIVYSAVQVGAEGRVVAVGRDLRSVAALQQRLRLLGWLPLEYLTAPPTIRITIAGHLVDTFVGSAYVLDRQYLVEPGWLTDQPKVTLAIDTSATTRAPGDTRELGVSIESVTWRDAPAPPTVP